MVKCKYNLFTVILVLITVNQVVANKYAYEIQDVKSHYSFNEIKDYNRVKSSMNVFNSDKYLGVFVDISRNDKSFTELKYSLFDTVIFYQKIGTKLHEIKPTKDLTTSSQLRGRSYLVKPESHEVDSLFIVAKSVFPMMFPVRGYNANEVIRNYQRETLLFGLFWGIIGGLFFYNLFLFFSTGIREYIWYDIFLIFLGVSQAYINGVEIQFLSKLLFGRFDFVILFTTSLAGFVGVTFSKVFLKVKSTSLVGKILVLIMVLYLVPLITAAFGYTKESLQLLNILAIPATLFLIIYSLTTLIKGFKPAKYYVMAWLVFLLGILTLAFRNIGLFEFNAITSYSSLFGTAFQSVLLSLALADRINILRKEKEQNQQEALKLAKENERITRYQNIELDRQVKARTAELEESNKNLQKTLSDLKEAQTQLVDSEKMASLGQLTAGIAHEINNPINFVTSNIKPLQRDIKDLYEIIDSYGNIVEGQEIQGLKEVEELKEDLEYDYVRQEIDNLLLGISEGANRTADIIIGLKTFSRLDEDVKKAADIVEGIESTLIILNTKIKDKIKLEKDYQEGMPQIECFPGKLNQAFMNILNNAIYALEHKNYEEGEKPTLTIKLRADEKNCYIHIIDNGIGMDEATQKKMFEPFYTTKEVGEGTGLGMSIVFNILDKHNGTIDVKSEEGKGTEFILTLPL